MGASVAVCPGVPAVHGKVQQEGGDPMKKRLVLGLVYVYPLAGSAPVIEGGKNAYGVEEWGDMIGKGTVKPCRGSIRPTGECVKS